jgi:hypothetical protein
MTKRTDTILFIAELVFLGFLLLWIRGFFGAIGL